MAASDLNISPTDKASICSTVISSAASIPPIFWTISLTMSRSRLCLALSWLATYWRRPVRSMLYLLYTVPQKVARAVSQIEMEVPSVLVRFLLGSLRDSQMQKLRTSKIGEILERVHLM